MSVRVASPQSSQAPISSLSRGVRDRLDRAASQRLFLIAQISSDVSPPPPVPLPIPPPQRRSYAVLGSTGNVYSVTLCRTPTCTCPDGRGGRRSCKHLLFVYLRVLALDLSDPLLTKRTLESSDLQALFAIADDRLAANAARDVTANESVRAALREVRGEAEDDDNPPALASPTGKASAAGAAEESSVTTLGRRNDSCPICFEDFEDGGFAARFFDDDDELMRCGTCRHDVHKTCFQQWGATMLKTGRAKVLTCVLCRAVWAKKAGPLTAVRAVDGERGFINFASLQGGGGGGGEAVIW